MRESNPPLRKENHLSKVARPAAIRLPSVGDSSPGRTRTSRYSRQEGTLRFPSGAESGAVSPALLMRALLTLPEADRFILSSWLAGVEPAALTDA